MSTFEFNTPQAKRVVEDEFDGLKGDTEEIRARFRREEEDVNEWMGLTDKYAQKMRPQWDEANEAIDGIGEKISQVFGQLTSNLMQTVEGIERTDSDARNLVDDAGRRSLFPDGSGSGGGRR
ncbi:hypothetical protein ACFUIW_08970 [Streptomyces sp. NPDC057245]|uniref:hypothetical protein n=1 Tax=Streptomyces sp. NPDC057245 TaxID=3346065 RepID=UPI003644DC3D